MIKPQRDLLKVLLEEKEEAVLPSGIVLPNYEEPGGKPLATGTVVAVGEGYWNVHGNYVESQFLPGDRVMFKNHPLLDKVLDNGVHYLLVPSAEVCATVEDDENVELVEEA